MMACHIIHQVRISLDVRRFIMKCTFRFLSCSAPSSLTIAIGKSFRHGVLLCTSRSFSRFSNFFASRSPPLVTAGKDLCLLCSLTRARASVLTRPCDVFLEAWSNASQHYRPDYLKFLLSTAGQYPKHVNGVARQMNSIRGKLQKSTNNRTMPPHHMFEEDPITLYNHSVICFKSLMNRLLWFYSVWKSHA